MALTPGTKLGPYEIVAAIGAGGMGEVYRARDPRLGRSVAIKVLPAEVSANAERKQRFEREARTISSLNHGHICALFDVGSQDGIEYLVLEYAEGETLEKRLERGALPLELLLRYGIEIGDALEKAHRSGIVHRDLKPANVMLTKSGTKLLDFGLAKWSAAGEEETLKTLTAGPTKLTQEGAIVGTFQYMAPEQLEGKEADARTDLFAFGEVLYEMATGCPAFAGKSKASLIAAILTGEPLPMSGLQPMTPPALERVVRGCLAKDPEERWQTAHDVKMQLKAIAEGGTQLGAPGPLGMRRRGRERVAWGVAIVAMAAAAVLGIAYVRMGPAAAVSIRAEIRPEGDTPTGLSSEPWEYFALSPDGVRIVYTAAANGKSALWLRRLDDLNVQKLTGTEDGFFPFWSPDGRFIGFFAGGKLKKLELGTNTASVICDAPQGRGGAWNEAGVIIFTPSINAPLYRVADIGGTPVRVTQLDAGHGEYSHRWPYFLPDGKHFLFVTALPKMTSESETEGVINVGSLEGGEAKVLLPFLSTAEYVQGYLLYVKGDALMAQRFDPGRLELSGKPTPIAHHILRVPGLFQTFFSASTEGILAYEEGLKEVPNLCIWTDRTGRKLGELPGGLIIRSPRFSPDGKKLVYDGASATGQDVWIFEFARNIASRLTFGSDGLAHTEPVWSADGKEVVYAAWKPGMYAVHRKRADGSGVEEVAVEPGIIPKWPWDWSRDGKYVSLIQGTSPADNKVMIAPLSGDRKPFSPPSIPEDGVSRGGRFSPDGKWIAYSSLESGRAEVYVAPFPGTGAKWQLSSQGGSDPVWRGDGRELYYLGAAPEDWLMAVDVRAEGKALKFGAPHQLFQAHAQRSGKPFDTSRDGQRFAITMAAERPTKPIIVVTNWMSMLNKE